MIELLGKFKRFMGMGLDRGSAIKMTLQLVLALCAQTSLLLAHTRVTSGMMGCIFSREADRFRSFLKLCVMGSGLSVACALIEQWIGFIKSTLELKLHEGQNHSQHACKYLT